MRNFKIAFIVFTCIFITSCVNYAKQDDVAAGKALDGTKGENINVIVDKIGPPDEKFAREKSKIYIWFGSRTVNTQLTSATANMDGRPTTYSPNSSGFNRTAPCRLAVLTQLDDTIIKSSFKGTDLGCQPIAQKINASMPQ